MHGAGQELPAVAAVQLRMRLLLRLSLLCVCFVSCLAGAEEFTARVIVVLDGDTVLVVRGTERIKIRLADIDAPEKDQPYGMASKRALLDRVLHQQVQINSRAQDDYGRTVAHLLLDGLNVNEEQVRQGMAWEYSHFHKDRRYRALQAEARQARRGLWEQDNPTPPWQWRKAHPRVPR